MKTEVILNAVLKSEFKLKSDGAPFFRFCVCHRKATVTMLAVFKAAKIGARRKLLANLYSRYLCHKKPYLSF